jgi:signal recognition particle subunit SRP54
LSLSFVTGLPLKFLGIGEKIEDLEPFSPERVAGRILGMGDVVTLVEKMTASIHQEDAAKTAASFKKGTFTLDDLSSMLQQMEKMGGLGTLAEMLPGMGKMVGKVDGAMEDRAQKTVVRHKAILSSMTPKERQHPGLLNGSRRKRIALGSGTSVPEVNRLMKQYEEMATMMKRMGKLGQKGRFAQGLKGMFGR